MDEQRALASTDALIGTTLGHCEIEELLGQGGMARVYLARQSQLDRRVAIKVLPPYYAADPGFIERFKQEARAMARLTHPHIVTVHDAGEEHGQLYIVMEYVAGGNLQDRMQQPLVLREIVRWVAEIASALSYAHANGIVHRDVKPVNVLLDGEQRAVLGDFGIAKMLASSGVLTKSGAGVGTPEYMSPEQCKGIYVDTRADIYALGVVLYELLTGRTPFEADNYTAIAHAHIYEPVPPPSRLNPRISPAVQSVILKALEKDPSDRFQDAKEMALALDEAVAAQTPVAPSAMPRFPQPQGRAAPVSDTRTCLACRAANPASQRFCTRCGAALTGPHTGRIADHARLLPPVDAPLTPCPSCNTPNVAHHRYCTRCGQSLGLVCAQCGCRNTPGRRFCSQCGGTLV